MKLLHLIIAESALEVKKIGNRLEVLDRSRHHSILQKMPNSHKRGRPDIVYLTLQVTQYTPLNAAGLLRTYVHTLDNHVLIIEPETRIPHNYINFLGLIRQLYEIGKVPPQGKPLIILKKCSIEQLVKELKPSNVILLDDIKGRESTFRDVIELIVNEENPCVIIGGFPHGSFSEETYRVANDVIKIGKYRYNTFMICAKLLTYLEQRLGIET